MKMSDVTSGGFFFGLDFGNIDALAESLGVENSPEHKQLFLDLIEQMYAVVGDELTGVVLEPNLSLPLLAERINRGLILRIDNPAPQDPLSLPTLDQAWSINHIADNYATASLNLYYHPAEEKALLKKQFLAEVYDSCHNLNIDLLLNLIVYTPADKNFDEADFANDQLTSLSELGKWADAFVLQYPMSALNCATLTASIDKPWILMGSAFPYEELKEKYREALENGAIGLLSSDSFYQGIRGVVNDERGLSISAVQKFISTEFRDRMLELKRISKEYQEMKEDL